MSFWKRVVNFPTAIMVQLEGGKSVAYLGQANVGKTRLKTYYEGGKLPEETEATHVDDHPYSRLVNEDGRYSAKAMKDVGGATATRDSIWYELVVKADVICYLVRADLLLANPDNASEIALHKRRMQEDITLIATWLRDMRKANRATKKRRKRFVLVFTYCDCLAESDAALMREDPQAFRDRLYQLDSVRQERERLLPYVQSCGVAYGSTMTQSQVRQMLKQAGVEGRFLKPK